MDMPGQGGAVVSVIRRGHRWPLRPLVLPLSRRYQRFLALLVSGGGGLLLPARPSVGIIGAIAKYRPAKAIGADRRYSEQRRRYQRPVSHPGGGNGAQGQQESNRRGSQNDVVHDVLKADYQSERHEYESDDA